MPRCHICGRKLIVSRTSQRLLLRCPKHGVVLRYYANDEKGSKHKRKRRG